MEINTFLHLLVLVQDTGSYGNKVCGSTLKIKPCPSTVYMLTQPGSKGVRDNMRSSCVYMKKQDMHAVTELLRESLKECREEGVSIGEHYL